jgi:hypothetical protein
MMSQNAKRFIFKYPPLLKDKKRDEFQSFKLTSQNAAVRTHEKSIIYHRK